MKLKKILDKYGEPDGMFFSFEKNKFYCFWGFKDTFSIYENESNKNSKLDKLQATLDTWKNNSNDISAIGFFSYDSKNLFFPHLNLNKSKSTVPLIWFGKPTIVKTIDRCEILNIVPEKVNIDKSKDIQEKKHYKEKIDTIKKHLYKGDVYQINYTQPMEYQFDSGSPFNLYLKLFQTAEPEFGCYLNIDSNQFISMSPENFFTKINSQISSYPIKGTRKRSDDIIKDQQLIKDLIHSEKDKAEHVMIVDLIRNDLGKICKYNSVNVDELFNVKSYNTIHHMVTKIHGELKENIKEKDIFKALFPGGSITGAPKQRAIEIIDEIENYSRGIYTGSMGLITNSGNMIFNIAIRTLTLNNKIITYPVGGGIVWDSNHEDERLEAIQKSKILS